jgi:hypothetical protein
MKNRFDYMQNLLKCPINLGKNNMELVLDEL